MQHIGHHNTGMDLILRFYERLTPPPPPPPPPAAWGIVGEAEVVTRGLPTHRGPTYHELPTSRTPSTIRCPPTITSYHALESPAGLLHHYHCQVVTSGDYQHSDFTFYDTLSWNNIHQGQESETSLRLLTICQKRKGLFGKWPKKIAPWQNSVNQYWAFLMFRLPCFFIGMTYIHDVFSIWDGVFDMRWSILYFGWCIGIGCVEKEHQLEKVHPITLYNQCWT